MIRNNNPGNIRTSADKWLGKTGADSRGFVIFDTLPHGYRALFKLLQGYMAKGFDTIDKVINRWAPPSENDTEVYIKNVVKRTGIPRYQKLTRSDLYTLGLAISVQEHGQAVPEAAKDGLLLIHETPNNTGSGLPDGGSALLALLAIGAIFYAIR